jgi:hypothetical protein
MLLRLLIGGRYEMVTFKIRYHDPPFLRKSQDSRLLVLVHSRVRRSHLRPVTETLRSEPRRAVGGYQDGRCFVLGRGWMRLTAERFQSRRACDFLGHGGADTDSRGSDQVA